MSNFVRKFVTMLAEWSQQIQEVKLVSPRRRNAFHVESYIIETSVIFTETLWRTSGRVEGLFLRATGSEVYSSYEIVCLNIRFGQVRATLTCELVPSYYDYRR